MTEWDDPDEKEMTAREDPDEKEMTEWVDPDEKEMTMTEWDDPDEIDALMKEAYGYGITNAHLYPIQKLKNAVRKERNERNQILRHQQKPRHTIRTPKYENIIGASEAKKAIINSIVRPTQHPELYPLGWERAILLFGPPGTGKTFLAAETSRLIDAKFIEKDAASVNSKWIGEAAQNVAKLFNVARELLQKSPRPIIIFIDEVDALFGKPQGCDYNIEMRNQFLKEMDAAEDNGLRLPLYLIAATNKPWDIDHGFLRRFQKRIYVKLPNTDARKKLFQLYTRDLILEPSFNPTSISELCAGYSPSDIRDLCRDASQLTLDRLFESEDVLMELGVALKPEPISYEDFKICLKQRNMSVSTDLINDYEKWALKHQAN